MKWHLNPFDDDRPRLLDDGLHGAIPIVLWACLFMLMAIWLWRLCD